PLLTVPILVGSLRGCRQMALVADSRALGVTSRRTTYRVVALSRADRVALVCGVLLVVGTALVISHGGGRF
ncbi:MAG: energy-coupling factor transporter transmembrane protein EcfT, partial [Actinomycetota bacterium]|nr:energy-coupling factor transporter transmembrane protein EcfT [Actinomycetota bacterium]